MLSNTKIHGFGLVKWCKELIVDLYNLFVYILIHQQRSGHRTAINHDILFWLPWFKHIYVRYKIPPSNSLYFCIVFSVEYLQRIWRSKCFRISSRNILRIFFSRIRLCEFFLWWQRHKGRHTPYVCVYETWILGYTSVCPSCCGVFWYTDIWLAFTFLRLNFQPINSWSQ